MSAYMNNSNIGTRILERCDELAQISAQSVGVTRLYLTPEHRRAADLLQSWMILAGMTADIDAVGNVIGRYASRNGDGPYLLLGSHYDSVIDAGKYDGPLGIITAIDCVARLHESGERLSVGIEVVAFADEEGTRFSTSLIGSGGLVGNLAEGHLNAVDKDGVSVSVAMREFGIDPSSVNEAAHTPEEIVGYVELHIEQGPVLESEELPVGVVTSIYGQTRAVIEFVGKANHAGTVPMRLRHDPLLAASELVLAIEEIASQSPETVATVGQIKALPGAMNVIPGSVEMSVDVRSSSDEIRERSFSGIMSRAEEIARARGVQVESRKVIDLGSCQCSPELIDRIASAVETTSVPVFRLPSGAGHDGMAVSKITQIGMLFVRCKGGISHSPEESVTASDVEIAAKAMYSLVSSYN